VVRLRTAFSQRSPRRWIGAELMAYGAWTALLTYVGAFFVTRLSVEEAVLGWLLAAGAAAHFAASTRRPALAFLLRRQLVAVLSALMAVLFVAELGAAHTVLAGVAMFCLLGAAAGARSPVSASLGLDQLPEHPGAMMAARTAATQLGYLLGAIVGGAVIAGAGYAALGVVLAAGMLGSAALIMRVDDPAASGRTAGPGRRQRSWRTRGDAASVPRARRSPGWPGRRTAPGAP
jgi:predicted MFS family arabinose efflux permease